MDELMKSMPILKGGRVGFKFGGMEMMQFDKVEDEDIKESVKMVADKVA